MERLTNKRVNGIKTGYWSTSKKEELVQRLAEYEDTGLTPEQVQQLKERDTEKRLDISSRCEEHTHYKCPACGNILS